jgi:hypothetical protein
VIAALSVVCGQRAGGRGQCAENDGAENIVLGTGKRFNSARE